MHDPRANEYVFNRPPRIHHTWRVESVELPEPPVPIAQPNNGGWLAVGMPVLTAVVMLGAMAAISRGGNALLIGLPMALMAVMGVVTTVITNRAQARHAAAELARRKAFFEERLREREAQIRSLYEDEQRARRTIHPRLESALQVAGALGRDMQPTERLWERRSADPDFLELAIGRGGLPFSSMVEVPEPQRDGEVDPRLFALRERYATLDDVPITVPLREVGSLGIAGPRDQGLALLRALLWQAVVFHAPTELRIAVVYPKDAAADWETDLGPWVPWLPHSVPLNNDGAFSARMHAADDDAVNRLMSVLLDQLSRRRDAQDRQQGAAPASSVPILVVVDGVERVRDQPVLSAIMHDGPRYNMFALFLVRRWEDIPSECGAMVDLGADGPRWARAGRQWAGEPFALDTAEATLRTSDKLARKLARIKLAESGSNQDVPRSVRLFELLGIDDEADLRPPVYWGRSPARAWHPDVPIGLQAGKRPLQLDLFEQAHGPHGIIAGTTGAGKSVLLQSVIAALAITHSPLQLQLLLIDFKGGASLAQLSRLPHTVGFVTDLEGRLAERAMTAIKSELRQRKTLFREAERRAGSKVENIGEYREKAGHDLPPLPNLLIVIDEFDEMVQTYKEFVSELVRVVKQGRSLGVHLLLASQQPSRAVTDDIRTQLKYFIALRLGSSEDSREMLEKPDAAFLPTDIPGRAYFRVGRGGEATLFQVAQVTGTYQTRRDGPAVEDDVEIFDEAEQRRPVARPSPSAERGRRQLTDLDVLVPALQEAGGAFLQQEFARSGWRPRPIWQPPLPSRLALSQVTGMHPVQLRDQLGRAWSGAAPQGWLRVALGWLDIPQESRQEELHVSLAEGHLAVIGASGSGKTMLLRTLLLSLALAHAPGDVWCYVVDAGGQGLSSLASLPHVGALLQPRDRDRVRRLLGLVDREILRRQELFREAGASDLPAYRRHARLPAWVVVIDKIALLREEFKDKSGYETITEDLARLARVGRAYGVHFVITADSVKDMTHQLFSLCDTRIALRLPDLHDYSEVLGTRVAAPIPASLPGRGLCVRVEQGLLELHVALPLLEPPPAADAPAADDDHAAVLDSELSAELRETVAAIAAVAPGRDGNLPAPIALLPDQLLLGELHAPCAPPAAPRDALRVPIGRDVDLGVGALCLGGHTPHALVIGGPRSGKTTLLQAVLLRLSQGVAPDEVRLAIVDPRRGLRAFKDLPHTEAYAATRAEVQALADSLGRRLDGPAAEVPRLVVVVDDYDAGYKNMEDQFRTSYEGPNLYSLLKRIAGEGGEHGVHLLVAANLRYAEEAGDVVSALDAARNGVILWPHKYDGGTRLLDIALPWGERDASLPPGRALLVHEDACALLQVAMQPRAELEQAVAAVAARAPEEVSHA